LKESVCNDRVKRIMKTTGAENSDFLYICCLINGNAIKITKLLIINSAVTNATKSLHTTSHDPGKQIDCFIILYRVIQPSDTFLMWFSSCCYLLQWNKTIKWKNSFSPSWRWKFWWPRKVLTLRRLMLYIWSTHSWCF